MKAGCVTLFSLLLFSQSSFGHGMNKHGPNGGYIQMPGAFHTELVDQGPKMAVYLLDFKFKDPVTTDSSVEITYKGDQQTTFSCLKKSTYFECDKPQKGLVGIKEILLNSVRAKSKGRTAVYAVPLKLDK